MAAKGKRWVVRMVSPDGKQYRDVYVDAADEDDARDICERQAATLAQQQADALVQAAATTDTDEKAAILDGAGLPGDMKALEDDVAVRKFARDNTYVFESATPEQ